MPVPAGQRADRPLGHPAPKEDGHARLDARVLDRTRDLLEDFVAQTSPGASREAICASAGELMERFSEAVLRDLAGHASGDPGRVSARWLHERFDHGIGHFAMELRGRTPEHLQHAVAQVLQIKVLQAERLLLAEIDRLSPVLSAA
jgi:hypothetical protein